MFFPVTNLAIMIEIDGLFGDNRDTYNWFDAVNICLIMSIILFCQSVVTKRKRPC